MTKDFSEIGVSQNFAAVLAKYAVFYENIGFAIPLARSLRREVKIQPK